MYLGQSDKYVQIFKPVKHVLFCCCSRNDTGSVKSAVAIAISIDGKTLIGHLECINNAIILVSTHHILAILTSYMNVHVQLASCLLATLWLATLWLAT